MNLKIKETKESWWN